MKNKINSHIYVPKSILNRFAVRNEKNNKIIYYIDLENKQIKTASTKSFNTQLGYYHIYNEQILKNEAEDKIGEVIRKIEDSIENVNLNEVDITLIKKFLVYQLIRTDYLAKKLQEIENLDDTIQEIKNDNIFIESKLKILFKTFEKCDVEILINTSSSEFVLTSNATYVIYENNNSNNDYMMVQVLSPKIAILFYKENTLKKLNINKKFQVIYESNSARIENLNLMALATSIKGNAKFIVGKENDIKNIYKFMNNK